MKPNICCAFNASLDLHWVNKPVREADILLAEANIHTKPVTVTSNKELHWLFNLYSYKFFDRKMKLFIYMIKECTPWGDLREREFTSQDRKNYASWVGCEVSNVKRYLKELVDEGLIEKDGGTVNQWFVK